MKLAQALNLRKKGKEDLARLIALITAQSVAVAGDPKPEQSCGELIQAILDLTTKQIALICQINATNAATKLEALGSTIAEAIVRRNTITSTRMSMESLLHAHDREERRYDRDGNIVIVQNILHLDLSKVRRILDQLSSDWRRLDDAIQQANWTVDLIEGQ